MAACLHFNKRIGACEQNRAEQKWDKFVMPMLAGKTVAFLGFGSIGQTTAKLCQAFGMKILTVRRDASRPLPKGLEQVTTYGLDQKLRAFAEADFVISVFITHTEPARLLFFFVSRRAQGEARARDRTFSRLGINART